MNDTMTTKPSRQYHPPEQTVGDQQQQRVVHRVGAVDRIALHLGVALITWSRRPRRPRPRLSIEARAEQQLLHQRLANARVREELNYPRFIIR